MAERQRRSLLPQKISDIQSGGSHASVAKRSIVVSGTHGEEVSGLENVESVSRGKNVQHPLSNIARPVFLRKSEPREKKAQNADRKSPSTRREVSNSRVSYLATCRAPHPRATGTENLNASRAKTGQQTEEASDADRQILGNTRSHPSSKSHTQSSLPNISVDRHPRASSQIPDPWIQDPLFSSPSGANSKPRQARPSKPASSTIQMHLTQRKALKASASSLLAQPSHKEMDTEKASAETASLQAELARLHLLHRSSADIQNAWNRSAETRLRLQFDRVSKQSENTKELDIYHQNLRNYPALLDWSQGYSNVELAEKLDSLSHSIVVMSDFASSDSRYNHVIKTFDTWFLCTTRIIESRSMAKDNAQDGIEFIEALGDGWRSEVASLEKKVMSMSRDLGRLGEPQESSNLAYVISLLRSASASKLEELQMVKDIETAVMVSEVEWIRKEVMKVALGWSSSGKLLVSGSDDKHLNIHSYQPESSTSPFALTTTVSTGHSANIFSVKFMPHSNDRTLVTCAGDSEVRVFDLEYSGQSTVPSERSSSASSGRASRFNNLYDGVRHLSDANTNTRVYRSHADRVKRIVTESSPNVFLTCSEDGEVRQFDLRQPSSAYPAPRGGRGLFARDQNHDSSNLPPPLISYKRFNLDLNTISCSGSQPHYIALGGAHLHCFLHDRRMIGRDRFRERGTAGNISPAYSMGSHENDLMGQATQCVRKFAPNGRGKMRRKDYNGHITACKISDANPNEMIASWSGDCIYSFDLIKSPDAADIDMEGDQKLSSKISKGKSKESSDRKRKRKKTGSGTSAEGLRKSSKPRSAREIRADNGDLALRVQYENGQREDIALDSSADISRDLMEETRESLLNESQKRSMQIAKSIVKIRKYLFSLDASTGSSHSSSLNLSAHTPSFTSALGLAASCLPEMDEIIRSWRYPMNPDEEDVILQQTLRANRDSSRRFVQAAGTLAHLLGGRLQVASTGSSALQMFGGISPAPQEGRHSTSRETFNYDFLKAIILWLEGGQQALLQGFKRPSNQRNDNPRFPIPEEAELSGIHEALIPYLLRLARETPIPNVDASRFEVDERRRIFQSESAAVIAFSNAIRMPLEDLSKAITAARSSTTGEVPRPFPAVQDKSTASTFWGFRVGRGLLLNAGGDVNFQFVDTAFGGLGIDGPEESRVQEDIDPDETEDIVDTVTLVRRVSVEQNCASTHADTTQNATAQNATNRSVGENDDVEMHDPPSPSSQPPAIEIEDADSGSEVVLMEDLQNDIGDHLAAYGEDQANEDDGDDDDGEDEDNDSDEDGDITAEERQFMFQSAFDRGKRRELVEAGVPYSTHSRQYRGHCNVRTVKDCNFFGLQDEYVVSGSDSGHLFIWDKRTSELLNILEGDGEVVNVVQGHPYEPLLAVSGIDHTIKVFSPDAKAQEDARLGVNGTVPRTTSGYSSLASRRRRSDAPAPGDGLASRKRMHESYEITSQNDAERQGGMREAYVSRRMLAQLAARLRGRSTTTGEGGEAVEEGIPIVLDDNCNVM